MCCGAPWQIAQVPPCASIVLMPFRKRSDGVAPTAVLVTRRDFDPLPHRFPHPLTSASIYLRATPRATGLAVHLQAVAVLAIVAEVRDRLFVSAVRTPLEQLHPKLE